MRVVVWGINYAPEVTGIAPYNVALCEFLRAQGHDAVMLTTFAYYPAWRKRPEDAATLYRTDVLHGVPVHRCWHFVPARVAAWQRILHEASFVLTSAARALALGRADIYVVMSPPLLLGAAGWVVSRWKRSCFVFHVQDLQPDAAVSLGMLRRGWFTRALYALEAFAYRKAARVSGISRGMVEAFRRKGVPAERIVYFPNGVRLPALASLPARGRFRSLHAIDAGEFVALYAGNLGMKQGLGILLDAAVHLQDAGIRILICGDGAAREALARRARDLQLPNVTLLALQSAADYQGMLVDADVCLVTQEAGSGKAFFPSKLLTALAFAKPVVTVADCDSELARAVEEGSFGINILPGGAEKLATVLRNLAENPGDLQVYSAAGRRFVEQFEMEKVLSEFVACMQRVTEEPAALSKRSAAAR